MYCNGNTPDFDSDIVGSSPAIPAIFQMAPAAGFYADAAKRITAYAPVAQEVEHLPFKQGVRGSSPRWSTKKERIRTGFSPFWWSAYGGQRSASLEFGERVIPSPLALTPCRFETWFGFGLPRCTTSKQGRRVMWRHKPRHIDRRPCFSFSVANPLRWALLRDRFGYGLPLCTKITAIPSGMAVILANREFVS